MSKETAISYAGVMMTITTKLSSITFEKDEQFASEMSNATKVIVDDKVMTSGEARRKWMHDKLDAWINGELDE